MLYFLKFIASYWKHLGHTETKSTNGLNTSPMLAAKAL